nr:reverse transcriptase domain-containing protein [Tanacetum cinerariifolium]
MCEAETEKSSVHEPPTVELKVLPPHLEYAFLEGEDKLPVIIVKDLSVEEKDALITVLKSHKRAITWKLSDIKDPFSKGNPSQLARTFLDLWKSHDELHTCRITSILLEHASYFGCESTVVDSNLPCQSASASPQRIDNLLCFLSAL